MTMQLICFVLFLLYFVGYETYWGLTQYKKIIGEIKAERCPKTKLYVHSMLGLWIPAGLVGILVLTGQFSMKEIGLTHFQWYEAKWLVYVSVILAGLYFLYLAYSLIVLRMYARKKVSVNQSVPEQIKILLPITKKEKTVWFFTAITAGITEEILYRGFFFSVMAQVFPDTSVLIILITSTLIFAIGHLYQGIGEVVKPALLGFLFGTFYIAFGTILPCILLHIMQDLCVIDLIQEQNNNVLSEGV